MQNTMLMIVLVVICNSAMADWVSISTEENRTIFADPTTMVKNGSMVEMWGMFDFKEAHISDAKKSYKSLKFRDEFNCAEKQSRNLFISVHADHMGGGEVVSSYADPSKWLAIDGIRESLWKIACAVK